MNAKNLKNLDQSKSLKESDESSIRLIKDTSPRRSPGEVRKRNSFKRNRFDNIFKTKKEAGLLEKFGKIGENLFTKDKDQIKIDDEIDLKEIGNQINKQIDKKRQSKQDATKQSNIRTISDDVSAYEQMNSLRFEENNVRRLAKMIFLLTLLNLCYTIFLTCFNPLNRLWINYIENYGLEMISKKCSNQNWHLLNHLIKNLTCNYRANNKT